MRLSDPVVWLCRGPDLHVFRQQTIGLHLSHRAVQGSIAIERDGLRRLAPMPDGLAEKSVGCGHIVLCPEHEVFRLASPIHRPVQICLRSKIWRSLRPNARLMQQRRAYPEVSQFARNRLTALFYLRLRSSTCCACGEPIGTRPHRAALSKTPYSSSADTRKASDQNALEIPSQSLLRW